MNSNGAKVLNTEILFNIGHTNSIPIFEENVVMIDAFDDISFDSVIPKCIDKLKGKTVSLITDSFNANIKIYENKEIIENVTKQIDIIYKQIKKNEKAPKTDYLFNNSIIGGKKNLENTIKKIETMNSLINFVPRK